MRRWQPAFLLFKRKKTWALITLLDAVDVDVVVVVVAAVAVDVDVVDVNSTWDDVGKVLTEEVPA